MYRKYITYQGITQNQSEWARELGVSIPAFKDWVKQYGSDNAIKLAKMSRQERIDFKKGITHKIDSTEPEPYDPDLEYKNRLKHWRKAGMSKAEIEIKARMI